jgi:hypothetical protein
MRLSLPLRLPTLLGATCLLAGAALTTQATTDVALIAGGCSAFPSSSDEGIRFLKDVVAPVLTFIRSERLLVASGGDRGGSDAKNSTTRVYNPNFPDLSIPDPGFPDSGHPAHQQLNLIGRGFLRPFSTRNARLSGIGASVSGVSLHNAQDSTAKA